MPVCCITEWSRSCAEAVAGCPGGAGHCPPPPASCFPYCGDGVVCGFEECDDGDGSNGPDKACTAECTNATCGDGVVWAGVEACDDGNADPSDACVACAHAVCGDGVVWAGVEACDDGNVVGSDACAADCSAVASCGDGVVWAGVEECDDGNADPSDACVACRVARCGDGVVRAGVEECDNGLANSNTAPDACRLDCSAPACGDGVVDSGEDCETGPCCSSCRSVAAAAACGACVNGTYTVPGACGADGNCLPSSASALVACAPFACDPAEGACRTRCATNAHCAPPALCSTDGLCEDSGADASVAVPAPKDTTTSGDVLAIALGLTIGVCSIFAVAISVLTFRMHRRRMAAKRAEEARKDALHTVPSTAIPAAPFGSLAAVGPPPTPAPPHTKPRRRSPPLAPGSSAGLDVSFSSTSALESGDSAYSDAYS